MKIKNPNSILLIATLAYFGNFIDRIILNILFAPIKQEFLFTDFELAILSSTSFILFYSIVGIYAGKIADKTNKVLLSSVGIFIWSIATGLIYFADSFLFISICRIFVGVGQALFFPAVISILSNNFNETKRATAFGIFSLAIAGGAGASNLFGAEIAQNFGWRNVFLFLGFPGIIFAIIFLFINEKTKDEIQIEKDEIKIFDLIKNKKFLFHIFGYGFFAVNSNSMLIWFPSYLQRVMKYSITDTGWILGIILISFGVLGTLISGIFADKYHLKYNSGRMQFSAILSLFSIIFWGIFLYAENNLVKIISMAILIFISFGWFGAAVSDLSNIFSIEKVGTATGIYLFVVNLIGNGIAPPIYGALNDFLNVTSNPQQMFYSLLISPISAIISSAFLIFGSKIKSLS